MNSLAPPNVTAWPGVELAEPLTGGVRNPVFRAWRGGQELVVRTSGRPAASLEWELDLLAALRAADIGVPDTVSTQDGRRHDHGVVVQRFVSGGPPRDVADWRRAVATVRRVHEVTAGWPQRPGFASAAQLLESGAGGDVDLAAMPAAAAELVRVSWRPVLTARPCVVHGDFGGGNVLVSTEQVTLIDWDESRVDVPAFDLAHVPPDVPLSLDIDRDLVVTAGVAWETATCWRTEPEYARRRLAELRTRKSR